MVIISSTDGATDEASWKGFACNISHSSFEPAGGKTIVEDIFIWLPMNRQTLLCGPPIKLGIFADDR